MGKEKSTDISELIQLMFVGLMGANKEIDRVLKNFHEKYDKPNRGYMFYEFFVHQPLHKKLPSGKKNHDEIWTFYPFYNLLARRSLMIKPPEKDNNGNHKKFLPIEDIALPDILIKMKDSIYTKYIYTFLENIWKKDDKKLNEEVPLNKCRLKCEKLNEPFINPREYPDSFFAKIKDYTLKNIGEIYDTKLKNSITEENTSENSSKTKGTKSNNSIDDRSKKSFEELKRLRRPLESVGEEQKITAFLIPIASSQVFYGDLFVCTPHFIEDDINYDINLKQLASELVKCVKKHHVPALALIHEHFFEKSVIKIDDTLSLTYKGKKIGEYISPICRSIKEPGVQHCYQCTYFGWEESSDNTVEKYLHKLWQHRRTRFTDKEIKESLFFKNRLYTDPKMLDVFEGFLKPSKAKLKNLPSVLVVASPGAGKEDIPTLLKLFTDYYDKGKTYKLNMASLKPDAIVPMAMVGGEIAYEGSVCKKNFWKETYKLEGILQKIRKETQTEFEKFIKDELNQKRGKYEDYFNDRIKNIINRIKEINKEIIKKDEHGSSDIKIEHKQREKQKLEKEHKELEIKREILSRIKNLEISAMKNLSSKEKLLIKELFGKFPTIMLDELNSMNIESQGVLLRFLERREITPIGSLEDEILIDGKADEEYREFITDFLVVGLMNEEPEEITREEAIRFLQKEKYIGGLLGDLLYEHIMKIRRLRPDLRARMMRNGVFRIPKLAEHRADIPHSFYNLLNKDKEDYFPNSEIRITMDALELLMSSELEWSENFRLLETVTKKVEEILYEDYENKRKRNRGEAIQEINGKDLIIIREKHIRKAMKEIGMLKESGIDVRNKFEEIE